MHEETVQLRIDATTSDQIQVLLQRLNRELDITLLMVTHDHDVAAIATRRLILDEGRIVDDQATVRSPGSSEDNR